MTTDARLRRTTFEWIVEALALLGVLGGLALVALHWDDLPGRVPSHFDALGRPDRWGEKGVLLLLPVMSAVLWTTLTAASLAPQLFNYPWEVEEERRPDQQRLGREMVAVVKAVLAWTLLWIVRGTIGVASGDREGLDATALLFLIAAVGGCILVYMVRFYRIRRR